MMVKMLLRSWAAFMLSNPAAAFSSDDAFKTMEEIAEENGFATENFTLVTPDDYVLSLYRIPGTLQEQEIKQKSQQQRRRRARSKPVVLMMHAQDCDMMEWVWNDSERSNAFILARAGYDVWLGNNRGNRFSDKHLTLTTRDEAYWEFYQEDMGRKDLPTFVDFILDTTGHSTLSYVGHSEGTTQMFLGASLDPDYFNSRINVFIALAPVASTAHISNRHIVGAARRIKLIELALVREMHYYNWFAPVPDGGLASMCRMLPDVCRAVGKLIVDDKIGVDNADRFDVFLANSPSGGSYRNFVYYAQMINSGKYTLYDYGPTKNRQVYGQMDAPLVPIEENYRVPTVLLSGDVDQFATPTDVAWLSQVLGDNVVFEREYHMDHLTFTLGKNVTFFQEDAVAQLQKFNPTFLGAAVV